MLGVRDRETHSGHSHLTIYFSLEEKNSLKKHVEKERKTLNLNQRISVASFMKDAVLQAIGYKNGK